jgi:hypothetical protein
MARDEKDYLAITTVVHELLSLGKIAICRHADLESWRCPRMIGQ